MCIPTGRNAYDANVSAHDMRETYLAGWKAAAAAGIQGLMCSSNAVNGIPLCAHADLLDGVMRKEFGMSGAVISDGNGVTDIYHQPVEISSNRESARGHWWIAPPPPPHPPSISGPSLR